MKMEEPFSYDLLDLSTKSRSIRFLKLLPASSLDADIHCTIFHGSLEVPPSYEALSYVWGTEPERLPIGLSYDLETETAASEVEVPPAQTNPSSSR